jgi:mRNA interferase RelE/StbE
VNVQYRQAFLKDLKRLKNTPIYQDVYDLAFTTLPQVKTLREVPGVKALKGKRYRVRLGDYRVGLEVDGDDVQVMRVLHRREFYRYFP